MSRSADGADRCCSVVRRRPRASVRVDRGAVIPPSAADADSLLAALRETDVSQSLGDSLLAEDSAALAGLATAALGVWASHALDLPAIDGAASIVIGLLLAGVAVLLVREARGLLIGEGIRPETAKAVRDLVLETDGVREASWPLSMYIGPEEVLLTLDAEFDPKLSSGDVAAAVRRIEEKIRQRYPVIKRIYIESAITAHANKSPLGVEPELRNPFRKSFLR